MSILKYIILCFSAFVLMSSCFSPKQNLNPRFDDYQPIYKDNGGKTRTTFLNKTKVQQEKEFMALLKTIYSITLPLKPSIKAGSNLSEVDKEIETVIKDTENKIRILEQKIRKIDLNSTSSHEQLISFMKELNDLLCNQVGAINKFLNKRVNKIFGDISFATGSSKISPKGEEQLSVIIYQITNDVNEWRSYVSSCNQKVFENDLFILVIEIDGFADQQGNAASNFKLSSERAEEVKRILLEKLNTLILKEKINIVFNKVYSKGHGEELPPGAIQKGANDPNRRICLISSVVGPSKLLNSK